MNHFSASFSSNRGSIDRRINRQLFMSPISGRKRNISEADSQDNFSGLVLRTPQRNSREDEVFMTRMKAKLQMKLMKLFFPEMKYLQR